MGPLSSAPIARVPARPRLAAALAALLALAGCAELPTAPQARFVVTGKITVPGGASVADVNLYFYSFGFGPGQEAMTGPDGTFVVVLSAGKYEVDIDTPPYSGVPRVHLSKVDIRASSPRFDYQFAGHRVTGSVRDPDGNPILNADVYFYGYPNSVGAKESGSGFAAYVPDGTYSIYVSPASLVSGLPSTTWRDVAISADTTLDLSLSGVKVTGMVTGPDGVPMAGTSLYLFNGDASCGVNSAADGSYEMIIPPGIYERSAFPGIPDHYVASRILSNVAVTGPLTLDVHLVGVWWSGVVRAAGSGDPIAGAQLSFHRDDVFSGNAGRANVTSDATGAFRVSVEQGAVYHFHVDAAGYASYFGADRLAGTDSTFDAILDPASPALVSPALRRAPGPASDLPQAPAPDFRRLPYAIPSGGARGGGMKLGRSSTRS